MHGVSDAWEIWAKNMTDLKIHKVLIEKPDNIC